MVNVSSLRSLRSLSERGLPDAFAVGSVKLHDMDIAIHPVPSHMCTGHLRHVSSLLCMLVRTRKKCNHCPRNSVQGEDKDENQSEQWASVGDETGVCTGTAGHKQGRRKQETLCGGELEQRLPGNKDKKEP